jgi:hypothetical protein
MNWKTELQLRDLDPKQRIEATCKACGYTYYLDVRTLLSRPELQFIYMDELERMSICRARHCEGSVRLALVHDGETEGFVGGMA